MNDIKAPKLYYDHLRQKADEFLQVYGPFQKFCNMSVK